MSAIKLQTFFGDDTKLRTVECIFYLQLPLDILFCVCYNLLMVKILSLDLSTKSSGFCVVVDGSVEEYGTITSQDKDFTVRGQYTAEFVRLLCEKYGKFDKVVIEELKVISNQKTLVMLAIVQGMVLRELNNSLVEFVSPTVWRKQFSLNGKREEAKRKAIALCRSLGYKVKNDDEAEAILIGLFTLDKFVSV